MWTSVPSASAVDVEAGAGVSSVATEDLARRVRAPQQCDPCGLRFGAQLRRLVDHLAWMLNGIENVIGRGCF